MTPTTANMAAHLREMLEESPDTRDTVGQSAMLGGIELALCNRVPELPNAGSPSRGEVLIDGHLRAHGDVLLLDLFDQVGWFPIAVFELLLSACEFCHMSSFFFF